MFFCLNCPMPPLRRFSKSGISLRSKLLAGLGHGS